MRLDRTGKSLSHVVVWGEIHLRHDEEAQAMWEALLAERLIRAQPGKIILDELGGIPTGIRQLLRQRPLETTVLDVAGKRLVVPTPEEVLRVKAWLALSRNQTRDYLDIAALADRLGLDRAATVLASIDDYYADLNRRPEAVVTQLVRQLADTRPRDAEVTQELAAYKGLDPRWHDWRAVTAVLVALAERITR